MVRALTPYAEAMELFRQASEILSFDLFRLCLDGPEEKLAEDYYAQLAVHVANCAAHTIIERREMVPHMASGFSLGIFSALVAAGSLSFTQGLQGVKSAAEKMAEEGKHEPGAMAAIIGLTEEEVTRFCGKIPGAFVASVNNARQIVISGKADAVGKAMDLCQEGGALMTRRLPVRWAIHTPLMEGVSRSFAEAIRPWEIRPPRFPVMSYLRPEILETPDEIRNDLSAQFSRPNRWYNVLQRMMKDGVDRFIEVGPGDVLTRMVKWVDRKARAETAQEILRKGFEGSRVQGFKEEEDIGR
jgi:[acyl-carrier-protein] S-malonyltransferase